MRFPNLRQKPWPEIELWFKLKLKFPDDILLRSRLRFVVRPSKIIHILLHTPVTVQPSTWRTALEWLTIFRRIRRVEEKRLQISIKITFIVIYPSEPSTGNNLSSPGWHFRFNMAILRRAKRSSPEVKTTIQKWRFAEMETRAFLYGCCSMAWRWKIRRFDTKSQWRESQIACN